MRYFTMRTFLVVLLIVSNHLQAQWGAPYPNKWIDYSKPYVKIGILKKGLHRVPFTSLPKDFPTDSPEHFQLWRRGKQVSIISTANQEIVFYAVPNDGASDSLLYRPMSGRLNPYYSFYSDEGAYFLTVGTKPGNRAKKAYVPVSEDMPVLTHHSELIVKTFQQDYSLGTKTSVKPDLMNSYFEMGATRTSEPIKEGTDLVLDFKLEGFVATSRRPTMKLLLYGRSKNNRKIEVRVGKTKSVLRLVKTLDNSGFEGTEYAFEIQPEDVGTENNGVLVIRSVSGERLERFSIAYYAIEYAQTIKIGAQPSKEIRFGQEREKWGKMLAGTASDKFRFFDITDADNPVMLSKTGQHIMVPGVPGGKQTLLATSEMTTVDPAKLRSVHFKAFDPKSANYIIITTGQLAEGATAFAKYRASNEGGGLKPVVIDVQDIYDQYNYGEPSPVAIKKFMSYALSNSTSGKYLFLIGKSVTQNEKMVREIPGEVPTIGFPGSDAMLVEGIAGAAMNFPAIPVGRLSAVTNQNITDYLDKVKAYESNKSGDLGWRKRVLHLSGGKTTSEIVQLRDHLRVLEPIVEKGPAGGTVKSYVKQTPMEEVEAVDITKDVNEGVGLITFFGHGSTLVTDPDIGYARDAARGYQNLNKYPVLYFNGCGVGNVFSNRFNANPANPRSSDRITLSLDWLVAPNRGGIAVIAHSYESYVSSGVTYLSSLYRHMFENPATVGLPIGNIQLAVAHDILSKYKDEGNVAYVQQSLLQGDPALRLFYADRPDYAVHAAEGITLLSDSGNKTIGGSDSLRINIDLANFGRFTADEIVPVEVICSGLKSTRSKKVNVKSFASSQLLQVSFSNEKDLKFIKVQIDPGKTLKELTRDNNVSELQIDWDLVKNKQTFSNKTLKDQIPPVLTVKSGGRLLNQQEPILPDPSFSISLTDDRLLSADTTLADIYIKPCTNEECDFDRITYAGNNIKMRASGDRELVLEFTGKLGPGIYEMMVNARDRAGNEMAQPYRMHFEIARSEDMQHSLVVSPNPATSYVRFELNVARSLPLKAIRYAVFDQRGTALEEHEMPVSNVSPTLEWYWRPGRGFVPGLYSYTVMLIGADGSMAEVRKGKVVLQ